MDRLRVKKSAAAVAEFCRKRQMKIIIDISGMKHGEVLSIHTGGLANSLASLVRFYGFALLYPLPFSYIKILFYRICGVKIGRNVYFAPAGYVDLVRPKLIEIGDNVMIGMGTNIVTHERSMKQLTIGRVQIGSNVTIGGMCLIRPGVIINDGAEIDAMVNVTRSVAINERVASKSRN